MEQKTAVDRLYGQNLQLGNRINVLNDENNFYKIQINNFNKLTNSINKDLYKLGINFQDKGIIQDSAKVGPLFVISNKIKLKNLQLKIGNSIRNTQKFKRNLEGSLPFISKEVESLERQISIILAKYLQMKEENQLLSNIEYGEDLSNKYKQFRQAEQSCRNTSNEISMSELQNRKKQTGKKLQFVKKEQKEKSRALSQLISINQSLQQEVNKLKSLYPESIEFNQLRAQEAKELQELQEKEKQLQAQIGIKSKELEEQYLINKECKQRINDKNYQESKEIKVLEEEVIKCREQVREFKQKYKKIRVSGAGKSKEEKKNTYSRQLTMIQ